MEIELLAPAGSYETLQAVIAAGADAVYVGGGRFGARAYAQNLTEEELLKAIDLCHLYGKKLYLTVNTLLKEEELSDGLCDYLLPYYRQGLDAVIVQDMGVFRYIRRTFPDLPVHASTQMTVAGSYGAAYLKELGAARIVAARELSLKELRGIHERTEIEIECFVHGALCYCYSGQCLLSSIIGGRSGNRGRCAQPCRLPYEVLDQKGAAVPAKGAYVLSPKDLCTIEHLPKLAAGGVHSFKIEGRMKQTAYAAGVVAVYRRYLDGWQNDLREAEMRGMDGAEALAYAEARYRVSREDQKLLLSLGNRSGFTEGYFYQKNGQNMITFQKPNHVKTNVEAAEKTNTFEERKEKIKGTLILNKEFPAKIKLVCRHAEILREGDVVQTAKKQPLTRDRVDECMKKTGGTPFVFEELVIRMDEDIFLPVQALNRLRRDALAALWEELLKGYRRDPAQTRPKAEEAAVRAEKENVPEEEEAAVRAEKANVPEEEEAAVRRRGITAAGAGKTRAGSDRTDQTHIAVSVETKEQLDAALSCDFADDIYLASVSFVPEVHRAGKRAYLTLPAVFRDRTAERYRALVREAKAAGTDGLVVKSYDALGFALGPDGCGLPLILDHSLYSWNHEARMGFFAEPVQPAAKDPSGQPAVAETFVGNGRILRDTVPLELNRREMAGRDNNGSEMQLYGRLPLMTSAQCVHANTAGCDHRETVLFLKDRYGKRFPVKNFCKECYNTIYNAAPLLLFDGREDFLSMGISSFRLSFTVEDKKETAHVLSMFRRTFLTGEARARDLFAGDYTNGHYRRGVE